VFLPGLGEDIFPRKAFEDPLLLDVQRAAISPDLATQDIRLRRERTLLHMAASAARSRLWISYPRMDLGQGRARGPSFYALDVLRAIRPAEPDIAFVVFSNNSQAAYISLYSQSGFADTLVKLGPGTPCDQTHACLVDQAIGCLSQPCPKGGYRYFLVSSTSTAPIADYTSSATPNGWGGTGFENYCSAEDAVLRRQLAAAGQLSGAVQHSTCFDTGTYTSVQ